MSSTAPLTLVVLAAGLGSRFGGPKQLAPVGPSGETLIEYSIFDAARAGFERFVFVLREAIEADFREAVLSRFADRFPCEVVLQRPEDWPEPMAPEVLAARLKPWGTGHALWAARAAVVQDCGIINGDDFYGAGSFTVLANALRTGEGAGVLVPFRLGQTLSDEGDVSRGICSVADRGHLESVREAKNLRRVEGARVVGLFADSGQAVELGTEAWVSMNLMGFRSGIWSVLEQQLKAFQRAQSPESTREYGLPDLLMAVKEVGPIAVCQTDAAWIGITHARDLQRARATVATWISQGIYPRKLW